MLHGYSELEKVINELLRIYGTSKLTSMLRRLSEITDNDGLGAVEKLFDLAAKTFGIKKREITISKIRTGDVVYARRTIVYILRNDYNVDDATIQTLFNFKYRDYSRRLATYVEECLTGKVQNESYFVNKFLHVQKEFANIIANEHALKESAEEEQ